MEKGRETLKESRYNSINVRALKGTKSIKRNEEAKFYRDEGWQTSVKGPIRNIFSFAGSVVSVPLSTQPLWHL